MNLVELIGQQTIIDGTKTDTVKQIGNAVCPEVAAALQSCHLQAA